MIRSTRVLSCWLMALGAVICAGGCRQDPAVPGGVDNFGRVSPELYRGAQPSATAFVTLHDLGIKTVIDLRATHSDADVADLRKLDLTLYRVPMTPLDADSDAKWIRFLSIVRDAPKPIFVHCAQGRDRTGCAVAVYEIVDLKLPKDRALAEMDNFHFNRIWLNIRGYIQHLDARKAEHLRQEAEIAPPVKPDAVPANR